MLGLLLIRVLLLALQSRITPGRAQGTLIGVRDRAWVDHVQGKYPIHILPSPPCSYPLTKGDVIEENMLTEKALPVYW